MESHVREIKLKCYSYNVQFLNALERLQEYYVLSFKNIKNSFNGFSNLDNSTNKDMFLTLFLKLGFFS